jgi:CDP-glucose 4,6-dehydratase
LDFSQFKSLRILVTGHTGFKGSWLSVWLNSLGAYVYGLALDPENGPGVFNDAGIAEIFKEDFRCDIRLKNEIKKIIDFVNPDFVFHLAAQPLVLKSYENPLETFETNVMGTAYVLEALRHVKNLKGILCVTTDKVYENNEQFEGYVERDHLGGYDPYSASKAASEMVCASFSRSFFNELNIPLATARAGNVIGGGDWAENRIVPDFFRALEKNGELEIRSPRSVRPWQHVLEPLSGYLTLADAMLSRRLKNFESFNFGPKHDAKVPVSEIIEGLNRIVGQSKIQRSVTVKFTEPKRHETTLLWLNCEKAKSLLKWQPRLNVNLTIEMTAQFYIERLAHAPKARLKQVMMDQIKSYVERS